MKNFALVLGLFLFACGGHVVADGEPGTTPDPSGGVGGGSGGASTISGKSGAGGDMVTPVACPPDADSDYTGEIIVGLVGLPCAPEATCSSNNGCGGCFVECSDGFWSAAPKSPVCYTVGTDC